MALATEQLANMKAVNQYMQDQRKNVIAYPPLVTILNDWDSWWVKLDNLTKSTDKSVWEIAKSRREQVELVYKSYKPLIPPVDPVVIPVSDSKVLKTVVYSLSALIGGLIILKTIKLIPRTEYSR